MNSSTVNGLFGNNGKPSFEILTHDEKALQENLGKECVVNKDFMSCVKHFKGTALVDTLSMNTCVVSCTKDGPTETTTKEGSSFANFAEKKGTHHCMSALVQEKGWTSKHPQHTGKQNPKEQKTTKGDPKGDVEFQLVFGKDIKEHLDIFNFESRCKSFCEKLNTLTDSQLTLKNLQLKTVKQHLVCFIHVMHWVNDGLALHGKVNLDGFTVDEINNLFQHTWDFIKPMAKQSNVNSGLRNPFLKGGIENRLDGMFRQHQEETSTGTQNLKMILGIPKHMKEQGKKQKRLEKPEEVRNTEKKLWTESVMALCQRHRWNSAETSPKRWSMILTLQTQQQWNCSPTLFPGPKNTITKQMCPNANM